MGNISPKVGGTGGSPYSFSCPQNTYVNRFAGRSGSWTDGLRAFCSDGTQSNFFGGSGGTDWVEDSSSGFTGWANARGGSYVDQLQFTHADGTTGPAHGGTGGTAAPAWACPNGGKIIGMSGGSGSYLDSVQFTCSMPQAAPAPAPAPTPAPTPAPSPAPAPAPAPSPSPSPAPAPSPSPSPAPSAPSALPTAAPAAAAASSDSSGTILLIVFVLLVLIFVAVIGYFLMRRRATKTGSGLKFW